jgi:hypothetical protein
LPNLGHGTTQDLFPSIDVSLVDSPLVPPAKQDVPRLVNHRLAEALRYGAMVGEAARSSRVVVPVAARRGFAQSQSPGSVALARHSWRQRVSPRAPIAIRFNGLI